MAKKKYSVVFPVNHDGEKFKPGDSISLEDEHAEVLLKRGTIARGKAVEPNAGLEDPKIGEPTKPEGAAQQLTADPGEVNPPAGE